MVDPLNLGRDQNLSWSVGRISGKFERGREEEEADVKEGGSKKLVLTSILSHWQSPSVIFDHSESSAVIENHLEPVCCGLRERERKLAGWRM